MKKVVTIIAVLLFTSCGSMYVPVTDPKEFTSEKILDDLDKSQNDLFIKSNEWMVKVFNNVDSVLEFSDKEEGVLIGKYLTYGTNATGYYSVDTRVFMIIDIRLQDKRAKILIKPSGKIQVIEGVKKIIKKSIDGLILDYENSLKAKKKDW